MKQRQFLEVLDRDEAERRWRAAIRVAHAGIEEVALAEALGRVLAEDVRAEVDVPGFDRSNMDGFAVRAADTFGASEGAPLWWVDITTPAWDPGKLIFQPEREDEIAAAFARAWAK